MNIVTQRNDWQHIRTSLGQQTTGFVPTMGCLHDGHMSLCERSKSENDVTVASIFVNPTQFNQTSDLQQYPRPLEQDIELLKSHGVDYLFLPNANDIYPDHYQIQVTETEISKQLEGEHRPGHFNGMLTVVLKLFNLIQPNKAYFGEKDYQQLLLVKKLATALFLPVEVIGVGTKRAEDGLALSSRNQRLTPTQRQQASHFPKLLHSNLDCESISAGLQSLGFRVDYISEQWQRRLGAVWLDDVRLIDNIAISED